MGSTFDGNSERFVIVWGDYASSMTRDFWEFHLKLCTLFIPIPMTSATNLQLSHDKFQARYVISRVAIPFI